MYLVEQDSEEIDLDPESIEHKIQVKRVELSQMQQETMRLLDEAQEQANGLIDQAQQQATQIHQEAQVQGFSQGYEQGKQLAYEEISDQISKINQLLLLAEKERKARIKKSESFIVELAMQIAQNLFSRELQVETEGYAASLTLQLLEEVDKAHEIEIRVSAEDFASVLDRREHFERLLSQTAECSIIIDHALHLGDVVIATEQGTVDGRLDIRFEQVRQILLAVAKEWEMHGDEHGSND
jgi:flagellar assembly protein FliH